MAKKKAPQNKGKSKEDVKLDPSVKAQKPVDAEGQRIIKGKQGGGPILTFPTVCWMQSHEGVEAMNRELEEMIVEMESKKSGISLGSIKGGYHSDRRFLDNPHPATQQLRKLITDNALAYLKSFWKYESSIPMQDIKDFRMSLSSWAVLIRAGSMSVPHLHPRANISGVYYVTAYEPGEEDTDPDAGNLVLMDPRTRAPVAPVRGQGTNIMIPPKEGSVVMFPSYLEHYVLPFKGEGHRISIAFNFTFSPGAIFNEG